MTEAIYLLGVDGGGTQCRAVLADRTGRILGEGISGSANIATDFEKACLNIEAACQTATMAAGLSNIALEQISAVLGLAGANMKACVQRLEQRFKYAQLKVVSDALIAHYGAFAGADGLSVIVGTGSVFLKSIQGRTQSFGGWGFEVSDFASGARLGQRVLEETLLAYDNIRPTSALTAHILSRFHHQPEKLVGFAKQASPADFAEFAPDIFAYYNKGDCCAKLLVHEAACDLNQAIGAIHQPERVPICVMGGLADSYAPHLLPEYSEYLCKPEGSALTGALGLAIQAR